MNQNESQIQQTTEDVEVSSSPSHYPNRNKYIVGIVGFLVVISAVIGSFYMGRSSASTEDNQTPSPTDVAQIDTKDTTQWEKFIGKGYNFSYPQSVGFEKIGSPMPDDCVKIQFSYSYLVFKLPEGASGGCTRTSAGAYSSEMAIENEVVMLNGEEVTFSATKFDNTKDEFETKAYDELYRLSDYLGKDSVIEFGGAYNSSEYEDYLEEKSIIVQILSTFEKTVSKESTSNSNGSVLSPTIPQDWKTYNKVFADAQYLFRYAPQYEIYDLDPSSGSIYLSKVGTSNYPIYLSINTVSNSGWDFRPYAGGSRRVWFKQNLERLVPDEDFSNLSFKEVNFSNGKQYLYISNFPENSGRSNVYIGIQNGIAITVGNTDLMPIEELQMILSSLEVTP